MPDSVSNDVSRRSFLRGAVIGGAAVTIADFLSPGSACAAGKMPPKGVNYRTTPNGAQRCDKCALWQAPNACKLVAGPIAPAGWCVLFKKK